MADVEVEIEVSDPSGLDLVEFDPGFPDNTNPKMVPVLFPATSKSVQWGYRLKNPNTPAPTLRLN